jgi:hypothetical protein
MKKYIIFFSVALLSGCSSAYIENANRTRLVYQEPTSNFARLRVSGQETFITPSSVCSDHTKLGSGYAKKLDFLWNNRYPDRDIGMIKPKKGEFKRVGAWDPYSYYEFRIQAGVPITIEDRLNDLNVRCGSFAFSFVPQANKDYQVRYTLLYHDGSIEKPTLLASPRYCQLVLDEMSPEGDFIPVKTEKASSCS